VKEKYFNPKYRPADILLNVKAVIYLKITIKITIQK
jgi:hypothetical protein